MPQFSNEVYAYALENALAFGKARESSILPKLFQHGLKKEQIKEVMPEIKEKVKEINSFSESKLKLHYDNYKKFLKEKPEQEQGLKELPNVKAKPVLRMAPFPSGAIHIGNSRTFLLNAMYAEKYKGKLLLVIDDTIGSDEKSIMPEAYKLIPEAFEYLKVKYHKPIIYKSDRLKIYYKYAEQLIKKDRAYVCSCSSEELRENRIKMVECACRQYPVNEQIKRWKKMFKARQGDYILRIKTSMGDPNPAFRDRVLFRISDKPHPRTGKKYKVWPLLEFSWAVDDHLLKVTHIIRGKELMMEGEMQKYIWDIFGWEYPEIIHNGLMKLEGVEGKLSKSKAQKEVQSGEYIGWDDPRTWSILSLARRGIREDSIKEFIENLGLTQNDITVPIDDLYSINRKKLDSTSNRYFFVENPVELEIKNKPEIQRVETKLHPEKKDIKIIEIGNKINISNDDFNKFKNKEIRLMHLYNIKLSRKPEFTSKENIPKIQKVQWVSNGVKTRIFMPNGTYSKGFAEPAIKKLKKTEVVQFERFGFCKFDHFDKKQNEYEFWFAHK